MSRRPGLPPTPVLGVVLGGGVERGYPWPPVQGPHLSFPTLSPKGTAAGGHVVERLGHLSWILGAFSSLGAPT